MAGDVASLMRGLGHERYAVVGHDRGSYAALRLALDRPRAVTALVALDSVPILEALERADAAFATAWWHWFSFAQPGKPERAILADPDAWYGGDPAVMGLEDHADHRVACPTLVLWSTRDDLEDLHPDVLGVWAPWTTDLDGGRVDSGHHMAEEAPEELAARITAFLTR